MADRLPRPCLALITDRQLAGSRPLAEIVARAVEGGVNLVQLREKDLPAGELHELACRLRAVVSGGALLLVNDRLDVALAAGLDGVHLPETGLPVAEAVRLGATAGLLVGRSVHDPGAAAQAIRDGAAYIQYGTVFPSRSKPGRAASGLDSLREVCQAVRAVVTAGLLPGSGAADEGARGAPKGGAGGALAVGGIDASNAAGAIRAGADGCAVISAIMAADDPRAAARALRRAIEEALDSSAIMPGGYAG